jgi:D-alanine-D-alanine ligase
MKIGLTYDLREDYDIESTSEIYADFCNPNEIGYLADAIKECGHEAVMIGNMYK